MPNLLFPVVNLHGPNRCNSSILCFCLHIDFYISDTHNKTNLNWLCGLALSVEVCVSVINQCTRHMVLTAALFPALAWLSGCKHQLRSQMRQYCLPLCVTHTHFLSMFGWRPSHWPLRRRGQKKNPGSPTDKPAATFGHYPLLEHILHPSTCRQRAQKCTSLMSSFLKPYTFTLCLQEEMSSSESKRA